MIHGKMIIARTALIGAVIAAPAAPGSCQPEDRHPETVTTTLTPGPIHADPGQTDDREKFRVEIHALWEPDRPMTATMWIDNDQTTQRFTALDTPEFYREKELVGGTRIKLLVEQHDRGGFLQCDILVDGKIAMPNGYMHRNDLGDCVVDHQLPLRKTSK